MQNVRIDETSLSAIVNAIRSLIRGRNNATGQVTLATGHASTTVASGAVSKDCLPQLTPASSAAAAEVVGVYVSAVVDGAFTIAHPNNATAGRVWNWHATGG